MKTGINILYVYSIIYYIYFVYNNLSYKIYSIFTFSIHIILPILLYFFLIRIRISNS